MDPYVAESARKHGVDTAGRMLEVGVVESDEGDVVVHAMTARDKYLRRM